jgi:hypothetical protein
MTGERTQLPKLYLRIDPNVDRAKADTQWAFIRLLCEANRQPRRGRFKNRALFDGLLGKAAARKLIAAGDAVETRSGEVIVPGWDEWQEGDVTVAERQRRIRERRRTASPDRDEDRDAAVTPPLLNRIPTPSPYTSTSRGTQVEGERALGERAGAQASGNADDGEAGLPDYDDPVTVACRLLPNGGRMLGNAEYRAAWDDLVERYNREWVLDEIPLAYNDLPLADRTKGWDFLKRTEFRLAERARAEELAAEKARQRADHRADQAHQREIRQATPEQREQAAYQRAAIRIGLTRGIPTPTDASEVRDFVMKHEPSFTPEVAA